MDEKEIQAWRDIIMTNTVMTLALVKVVTAKGLATEAEVTKAMEETKKELAARQKK
jgi:hypothetical protein